MEHSFISVCLFLLTEESGQSSLAGMSRTWSSALLTASHQVARDVCLPAPVMFALITCVS